MSHEKEIEKKRKENEYDEEVANEDDDAMSNHSSNSSLSEFEWETHSDFKSAMPLHWGRWDAPRIMHYVGPFLGICQMYRYKIVTLAIEREGWSESELSDIKSMKIDVEMIDRLYHVETYFNGCRFGCLLLARMQYRDSFVYLELDATCTLDWEFFRGTIFVTRENYLFFMRVMTDRYKENATNIYRMLIHDSGSGGSGESVNGHEVVSECSTYWMDVPSLQIQCQLSMCRNNKYYMFCDDILQAILPKVMYDNVSKYMRYVMEIRQYHNERKLRMKRKKWYECEQCTWLYQVPHQYVRLKR